MNERYDFGRNWSELAAQFDERHVDQACVDLARLVGEIEGRTFLDIGCGSGLHSAAALKLGAKKVFALDYDSDCVATTTAVLSRFAPNGDWKVKRGDALDPATLPQEGFDIVYSWGVLHHTGDMWRAIKNAAACVGPSGRFSIALYLKTPFCGAWAVEKKLYAQNKWIRPVIKYPYVALYLLGKAMKTGGVFKFVRDYKNTRGMEFMVDVDDWLGGYPYESVLPNELEEFVGKLGFDVKARFNIRRYNGILGTGCGEWKFSRAE
jgi:2-polyprenyl-6-hydroxyphenyl methylase/3-demethylubiquinone-9 3-methyltransferase